MTGEKYLKNISTKQLENNHLIKSEASVERISVCNIIENLVEQGIHSLPCSYTNDVINMVA